MKKIILFQKFSKFVVRKYFSRMNFFLQMNKKPGKRIMNIEGKILSTMNCKIIATKCLNSLKSKLENIRKIMEIIFFFTSDASVGSVSSGFKLFISTGCTLTSVCDVNLRQSRHKTAN